MHFLIKAELTLSHGIITRNILLKFQKLTLFIGKTPIMWVTYPRRTDSPKLILYFLSPVTRNANNLLRVELCLQRYILVIVFIIIYLR